MEEFITLSHGAGGRQTADLIGNIFKKYFANKDFTPDDAAVLNLDSRKIAFSTDGFIVSPWKFPGGNIGKLSICGTVNDLACMGARPQYLTCAMVIEEGFPIADLLCIVEAMAKTAAEAGVNIVAGDTKVAGKGQVDGIFITTTGVGRVLDNANTSGAFAQVGDAVIVTGDVGRHGCTILLERNEFGIEADVTSDCAPLNKTVEALFAETGNIHVIRDATRGGVGTVLYEICEQSQVGIKLNGEAIPVADAVRGVCGMLGMEPLYLACEGRLVIFAPQSEVQPILQVLHSMPYSQGAAVIGEVTDNVGKVVVEHSFGGKTILPQPTGELLPRIC
ncbi:MAG: hydrogenase expression/formation protein HypE [Lentisphaerae bacterium]|nr:hydrogenase expression/formation protein HypE [Lentisphaerota bacterium]